MENKMKEYDYTEERRLLGRFAVDSGSVMIGDPCYLDTYWNMEEKDPKEVKKYPFLKDFCMSGVSKILRNKNKGGELSSAVVSQTGYGDGEYKVFATYKDGAVKKLEIEFF
jgi:hypothetical protein